MNKNQDLGGLKIQAMGIFLQANVLGETDILFHVTLPQHLWGYILGIQVKSTNSLCEED